jgi:hypothetical protein
MIKVSLKQRRQSGNLLAEFAPTLFIIFITCFFPLMNLIGVCTGAVTVMLVTTEAASNAAAQESYANSLDAVSAGASRFLSGDFARFAHIQPAGGYHACGIDLYTQITSTDGVARQIGPNSPIPPPVDLTDNVYEFGAVSNYLIGPFVGLESVPFFGKIPGVGAPFRMVFRATRMVEHPHGLATTAAGGNDSSDTSGGSAPALFDRSIAPSNGTAASYNYGEWRTPNIFDQIAAAGQTVVSINVVSVDAAKGWQASGVSISAGQTAWIDTNAVGQWLVAPNSTSLDANGWQNDLNDIANMMKNAPSGGLIGYGGSSPPTVVPNNGGYSQPGLFVVGDTLTNYKLANPGPLNFMINDNDITDNSGTQVVRVIVTQSQS